MGIWHELRSAEIICALLLLFECPTLLPRLGALVLNNAGSLNDFSHEVLAVGCYSKQRLWCYRLRDNLINDPPQGCPFELDPFVQLVTVLSLLVKCGGQTPTRIKDQQDLRRDMAWGC